jgi:DNA-directed RNA polymerase specialized sigma24 family protein
LGGSRVSFEDLLKYLARRAAGSTEEPPPGLVEFLVERARAHPRHHRTGRPLRWDEISVLAAATYAVNPALRREDMREDAYRRPKGAVLPGKDGKPERLRPNHSIWTVENVLRLVLGIHEGLRSSRKLWNYIADFDLHKGSDKNRLNYGVMQAYGEALVEVMHRANRHKFSRPGGPWWRDNEAAIRYLHTAVTGEASRRVRKLISNDRQWGDKNYWEAKEDGKELPKIRAYNDGSLVGGNGSKRSAPVGDEDDQAVGEVYLNRITSTRKRGTYETQDKSEFEVVANQRAKDHDRIPKTPEAKVISRTVLPRDREAIEEERAHWTQGVGGKVATNIGIPCHNGPYMSSGTLEFWDLERQAKKRVPELTPQQRRVAILRLIGGLSNEQAAHVTGLSESAVRSHASEANRCLRELGEKELAERGVGRE